jgi:DUF4097 and DUF4098 domain-containing protein YvlB
MTTHRFPTPTPVHLYVENAAGSIEVLADAGAETTVDISGRYHEDLVVVELSGDGRRLTIRPRRRHRLRNLRLDITVHLPAGSTIEAATASAGLTVHGEIADLKAAAASAAVSADDVTGSVAVQSASGSLRVGAVGGSLSFTSASGSLRADRVGGECHATTASGSLTIGVADDDVAASAVSGSVTVREAHRGTVDLSATSGSIQVGVRRGTVAWLDVSSLSGHTRSDLTAQDDTPAGGGSVLTVRARSVSGSVAVVPAGPAAIAL